MKLSPQNGKPQAMCKKLGREKSEENLNTHNYVYMHTTHICI